MNFLQTLLTLNSIYCSVEFNCLDKESICEKPNPFIRNPQTKEAEEISSALYKVSSKPPTIFKANIILFLCEVQNSLLLDLDDESLVKNLTDLIYRMKTSIYEGMSDSLYEIRKALQHKCKPNDLVTKKEDEKNEKVNFEVLKALFSVESIYKFTTRQSTSLESNMELILKEFQEMFASLEPFDKKARTLLIEKTIEIAMFYYDFSVLIEKAFEGSGFSS